MRENEGGSQQGCYWYASREQGARLEPSMTCSLSKVFVEPAEFGTKCSEKLLNLELSGTGNG